MVNGIIGKKIGMTQLFLEDGTVEPATVLQAGPCVVVQAKTAPRDGYESVQLGLVSAKKYKANKATAGHHKGRTCRRPRPPRGQAGQRRRSAQAGRLVSSARCSTRASGSTSSAPARATASRA